jgi:hypothetical protein
VDTLGRSALSWSLPRIAEVMLVTQALLSPCGIHQGMRGSGMQLGHRWECNFVIIKTKEVKVNYSKLYKGWKENVLLKGALDTVTSKKACYHQPEA